VEGEQGQARRVAHRSQVRNTVSGSDPAILAITEHRAEGDDGKYDWRRPPDDDAENQRDESRRGKNTPHRDGTPIASISCGSLAESRVAGAGSSPPKRRLRF